MSIWRNTTSYSQGFPRPACATASNPERFIPIENKLQPSQPTKHLQHENEALSSIANMTQTPSTSSYIVSTTQSSSIICGLNCPSTSKSSAPKSCYMLPRDSQPIKKEELDTVMSQRKCSEQPLSMFSNTQAEAKVSPLPPRSRDYIHPGPRRSCSASLPPSSSPSQLHPDTFAPRQALQRNGTKLQLNTQLPGALPSRASFDTQGQRNSPASYPDSPKILFTPYQSQPSLCPVIQRAFTVPLAPVLVEERMGKSDVQRGISIGHEQSDAVRSPCQSSSPLDVCRPCSFDGQWKLEDGYSPSGRVEIDWELLEDALMCQ
ncbi:hypothetical protein DL93DRAFT_1171150 [Clavulina sp. PMI_390]|nr:hypothetical protein DL93DRAFT_1171150 [Clavulina sp. PMI_390]